MKPGRVYLVGAGPGDPGLLTRRGEQVLARADVVVYDALVGKPLLRLARPGARLVSRAQWTGPTGQRRIEQALVREARKGLTVVRLKGGDPFVFGRCGEEAEALLKAKIPYEVVPGVTSAIAVPAYAGIPVTHRGHNSSFTVVTGHEDPLKPGSRIDWSHLAKTQGTLVFLMGLKTLELVCARLIRAGMAPATPAALIEKGTTARQRVYSGTLATLAVIVRREGVQPPAVLVVGDVVDLRKTLRWWEKKPLTGLRILVTREQPEHDVTPLLEDAGAEVIGLPAIELQYSRLGGETFLKDPASYDWVVLSSARGATWFKLRMTESGLDARRLANTRFACVGEATAGVLGVFGIRADLVPKNFSQEGLVRSFSRTDLRGKKVLLARAQEARDVLPQALKKMGAKVELWDLYSTGIPKDSRQAARRLFAQEGGADAVLFGSSLAVKNFYGFFNPAQRKKWLSDLVVASIGPVTSKAVRAQGGRVAVEPKKYTFPALVDSLVAWAQKRKKS